MVGLSVLLGVAGFSKAITWLLMLVVLASLVVGTVEVVAVSLRISQKARRRAAKAKQRQG